MPSYQKIVFFLTLAAILLMSAVTLIVFVADKRRAVKGQERVMEKTLLSLTACFGALGALIGRRVAHHKSNKAYFSIVIGCSLFLHAALIGYLAFLAFGL